MLSSLVLKSIKLSIRGEQLTSLHIKFLSHKSTQTSAAIVLANEANPNQLVYIQTWRVHSLRHLPNPYPHNYHEVINY